MSEAKHDELIIACKNGDARAYERLFLSYHERVYRVGLRYMGNTQEAEDVTQDVFLKVFKDINRFRGNSNFYTWLYRITVNICLDRERQRQRMRKHTSELTINMDPVTDGRATGTRIDEDIARIEWQSDAQKMLQKALSRLSPKLRTVIILKHIEELSLHEISKILNCSMGTISSRLNRGRIRLRDALLHMGVDHAYIQES